MHVLVTGGGSGGHVIPAIPVMEALRAQGHQVSYVGTTSGYEERLLNGVDMQYHGISSGKLRRYLSFENLKDVFKVLLGIVQAFFLLGRLRPTWFSPKVASSLSPWFLPAGCGGFR